MKFPIFVRNLSVLLLGLVTGGGVLLFELPLGIKIEKKNKNQDTKENDQVKYLLHEFEVPPEEATEEGPKNPFGNMNY